MNETPLYNSRIIGTFVEYLKKTLPDIDIDALLIDSGIACYEVEDEGHWLTQRQVDNFHDALMRTGADPSIFREAGRYMVSSRSIAAIRQFVMGFISPIHAYTMLGKISSYVNRGATYETSKIGPNKVEIITKVVAGVEEKPYQCENRKGSFEAVAKVFTNKLPVLEHPVCMHQGGNHCLYIISWDETAFLRWGRIRNFVALFTILFIILGVFFLPPMPLAVMSLFLTCAVLGTSHYSDHVEKKDIYAKIETQGNAANRLLDQITVSYNNSLLTQEIGQAVSSMLNIDELLKFVTDTLQKRLDFERGMIMLANEEKTQLVYVSGYGYNPAHEELLKKTCFHLDNPKSRGHLVRAFKEQKPFLITNIKDFKDDLSDHSYEFAEILGVRAFICVPIVYEGQSEGILAVDNPRSDRPLSQSEVSLLMGIAPQIAISINNAKSIRQARESEERFRALSENSPDIIYMLDTNGVFTYVNPVWGNILGYGREEVIGRAFTSFVKETDAGSYVELFKRVRKEKETVKNFKGTILARDGTERLFDMSGAPNFDVRGNITGIVGTFKDVTEQRNLEAQLLHASKMEAIGTLTGGISHDFNNIVQAISSYNQLLMLKKDENSPDWKHLAGIEKLTQRAANLVKQLLIFSRKVESKLTPIDLNEEIKKFHELLVSALPKTIAVKLDLADDLHIISGDAVQIGQVIMNLTVNAQDAIPDGGEIAIHTENVEIDGACCRDNIQIKAGRYVMLRISDTGCGMDKETLSRIFEPFFTTKEAGTGIGLSVVYGVAKNHNGFIFCDSEPNKGTTFDLYLPTPELTIAYVKKETAASTGFSRGQETILLVDDERYLVETCSELLSLCGYRVLTAESGEDALSVIGREKDRIALTVLDLMMPGMGGTKCLAEIKKIAPQMKVVVVSGYAASMKVQDIMKEGAAVFIQKPYRFEELSQKIRDILDAGVQSPKGRIPLHNIKGV